MTVPVIELDAATKRYGATVVVDGLTLAVPEGEVCALVGPSGSGKSTTVRLINRLVPLDGGAVRVGGVDVRAMPGVLLRRRIGYVIQSVGLFPHWTVGRNVATVPELLGWPRPRIAARVDELLDLVGLDPARFRDRRPHQLSGGQQQRVGVARALAADPDVLLMDEPFGALDPVTRDGLQAELLRIQRRTQKTVVIVTHDIDEAIRLADRIAVLDHGRLVQVGAPAELLRAPASDFVRDFVGGPLLGLRLLRVLTVAERMRPAGPAAEPEMGPAGVPAVTPDDTLDIGVAAMVSAGADRALVRAPDRGVVGVLHLGDVAGR